MKEMQRHIRISLILLRLYCNGLMVKALSFSGFWLGASCNMIFNVFEEFFFTEIFLITMVVFCFLVYTPPLCQMKLLIDSKMMCLSLTITLQPNIAFAAASIVMLFLSNLHTDKDY